MTVHAPAGATIQGGSDAPAGTDRHMTIVDQTTGKEFDLWHVSTSPLPAGGGTIVTEISGYTMINGDGLAIGSTDGNAGHFGNLAGRIRLEEWQAAIQGQTYINHALTIVVNCTADSTLYPATVNLGRTCDQIGQSPANAPPMGARLHLDMTLAQVNALPIPEWKKVLLRTLVVYGAIINDTGSSFYFDWQTESGDQYLAVNGTDPWLSFGQGQFNAGVADWSFDASWPGGGTYTALWQNANDGLDWTTQVWSHLEVLDPCVSHGTC